MRWQSGVTRRTLLRNTVLGTAAFAAGGAACWLAAFVLAAPACAQQAEPTAAQARTRLITLGTRVGPVPVAHQAQSANLLIVNGALYLIDAGDGTLRRLAKAGIMFTDIGVIFITHPHSDHMAGLGPLMAIERHSTFMGLTALR